MSLPFTQSAKTPRNSSSNNKKSPAERRQAQTQAQNQTQTQAAAQGAAQGRRGGGGAKGKQKPQVSTGAQPNPYQLKCARSKALPTFRLITKPNRDLNLWKKRICPKLAKTGSGQKTESET